MGIPAELKKRLKRKSKGQQLIEVTLIIAPLIFLVGAAVDWGVGLFVSHVVQNAVREGARAAVTRTTWTDTDKTAIKNVVKSVIPDAPLFSGFENSLDSDPDSVQCVNGTPPIMIVKAEGTYNFIFLRLLGFTDMDISREARMYYERFSTCPS